MKNISFLLAALSILGTYSCKKATPNPSNPSQKEFLEITIDGQNFAEDKPFGFNAGTVTGSPTLCDDKLGLAAFHTSASSNRFECTVNLLHYRSATEFLNAKTGNFTIIDDWSSGFISGTKYCNLTLEVNIQDNNNACKLVSMPVHKVNSISKIKEDTNRIQYLIEGDFSANYKNASNTVYPVSGKYSMVIETLK
ncbi:MAG: hypothetical protein ACK5CL_06625 [Sphingomonadales bacterium]|jgi:hypothetical protein